MEPLPIGTHDITGEMIPILAEDRRKHMAVFGKSGVGKTTLLRNMVMWDIRAGLGVELGDNDPTLRDLFGEPPAAINRLIKETHIAGLHIVPSNIRLARVAQALYMRPKREELLRRGVAPVKGRYDFIVVDCPPSLGVLTETGIAAADLVIIPCQMEARAADGLVDLLEVIGLIKGEPFDAWRILLTKMDSRKSTTNQAVMAALEPWQPKILKTSIPQSEPLNQAQIERTDIFTFDGKCKGAVAYEALTKELLNDGY
jgi:chromosome partitioning protein